MQTFVYYWYGLGEGLVTGRNVGTPFSWKCVKMLQNYWKCHRKLLKIFENVM